MTNHARIFKRALTEKLAESRKEAFIPMTEKQGQQAGPGGMAVDPMGGGAPMDPSMGGGAPMDPAMGGMPPMDPSMGGGAPMDPAMGGMPPMDPAMGGMPPMDPAMGGDPMAGLPPLPEEGGGGDSTEANISMPDVDALKSVQQNTMEIVRQTMEMVGKAKPKEEQDAETEAAVGAAQAGAADTAAAAAPDPTMQPGPITGQPGFDPSMVNGPLNLPS